MGKITLVSATNSFTLNGVEYQKGTLSVNHSEDGISIGGIYADVSDITIDGNQASDISALKAWVSTNCFKSGGGTPADGGVSSVTGNLVTGTDSDPVIDFPIGNNREVPVYKDGEVVAGRLGWSQYSDLPTPPPFLNGVLIGTAFKPDGSALFGFLEMALGDDAQSYVLPNSFPVYNPGIVGNGGGTLPVADGIEDGDAVNKSQLENHKATWNNYTDVPLPTENGMYVGGLIFYDGEQAPGPITIGFDIDTGKSLPLQKSVAYYHNALPGYDQGGQLAVSDAVDDNHAVNKGQLDKFNANQVNVKSGNTNIPSGAKGKFIFILDNDATDIPTLTLPTDLNTVLGLEIIIINLSDDRPITFRSFTSKTQILSSGSYVFSINVAAGLNKRFIVTKDFVL